MTGLRRVLRRGRPALDRRDRLELLETLSDSGCAPCRARENAVRRWFWTYENDTAGTLTMRLTMERSLGMCAAHTRRLLGLGPPTSWLATALFADVAHAGLRALTSGTQTSEPCPPCRIGADAATDVLARLTGALADPAGEPDVATYFRESDGLCLAHTRRALRGSGRAVRAALLAALATQFSRDPLSVRIAVCGYDPDVGRRAAMRRAGSAPTSPSPTSGRPPTSESECCAICAARLRAEWSALDRVSAAAQPRDAQLCGDHLAVLAADGRTDAVTPIIEAVAAPWRAVLEPYRDGASPGLPARRAVRARFGAATSCEVCAAGVAAATEARAEGSGPICLRHSPETGAADPRRGVLVDRLRALSAALDAARRAYAGPGEVVVNRAEATAWQRAPTVLDGAVLGPAGFSASS